MKLWVLIIAIAIPFVPRVVFGRLRKLFPLEQQSVGSENVEELRSRYQKWLALSVWLWLVLALPTGAAIWLFLIWLGEAQASRLGEAVISIFPDEIVWALAAFFFGLLAAVFPVELFLRLVLRGRYKEFDRWQELEYGWNSEAMARVLYPVLGALWLLFAGAIVDWYVVLSEKEMRINAFFSPFEQVYRYEELTAIRTAPRFVAPLGNEVEGREYVFSFQGGGDWSTRWSPARLVFKPQGQLARAQKTRKDRHFSSRAVFHSVRDLVEAGTQVGFSSEDKRRVAEWISEKSGVPITELDVLR